MGGGRGGGKGDWMRRGDEARGCHAKRKMSRAIERRRPEEERQVPYMLLKHILEILLPEAAACVGGHHA